MNPIGQFQVAYATINCPVLSAVHCEPPRLGCSALGPRTSNEPDGAANKVLPTSRRQNFPPISLPARCRQHPAVHGEPLSLTRMHWDHEPTRLRARRRPRPRRQTSQSRTRTSRTTRTNPRFMESPLSFFECIGTMNQPVVTPLVWSPAFRRSGPAKAGTPNVRFMERNYRRAFRATTLQNCWQ